MPDALWRPLVAFVDKNPIQIHEKYLIYTKDLAQGQDLLMLSVYLTMCLWGVPVKTDQIPAIRDILYLRLQKELAQVGFLRRMFANLRIRIML